MSFRRISLLTVLFLSLSATSTLAVTYSDVFSSENPQLTAQRFERGQGRRRGRGGDIMEKLDLSEAQKDQLQSIRSEYQPRLVEREEALSDAYATLREMMTDDASSSAVRRQHQQVQTLRQEMSDLRFESMLQMREVLTPEQREEFAELMEDRRAGRGRGRGRGRGFRGGRFDD